MSHYTATSAAELGAVIRGFRVSRGLSVSDAARRVGSKPAQVRAWEEGESVPDPGAWARLCNMMARGLRNHRGLWLAARSRGSLDVAAVLEQGAREVDDATTEDPDAAMVEQEPAPVLRVEDATEIGEAIRRARVIEGLTQRELAELMGVAQPTVGEWERGSFCPVAENVAKLVELMPTLAKWSGAGKDIPKPHGGDGGWSARTVVVERSASGAPVALVLGPAIVEEPVKAPFTAPTLAVATPPSLAELGEAVAITMLAKVRAELAYAAALSALDDARAAKDAAAEQHQIAQEALAVAVTREAKK